MPLYFAVPTSIRFDKSPLFRISSAVAMVFLTGRKPLRIITNPPKVATKTNIGKVTAINLIIKEKLLSSAKFFTTHNALL